MHTVATIGYLHHRALVAHAFDEVLPICVDHLRPETVTD